MRISPTYGVALVLALASLLGAGGIQAPAAETAAPASLNLGSFRIVRPGSVVTKTPAPAIRWSESAAASAYVVSVSRSPDCSTPIQIFDVSASNATTVADLVVFPSPLADGVYAACVTAKDGKGQNRPADNDGFTFEVRAKQPAFHLIFVTSTTQRIDRSTAFPPALAGIGHADAADWVCNDLAAHAGLIADWDGMSLSYRAVISAAGQDAQSRLRNLVGLAAPILTTTHKLVANDYLDLFDGRIAAAIKFDESGRDLSDAKDPWVLTGSMATGVGSGESCDSLSQDSASSSFGRGNLQASDASWIQAPGSGSCEQAFRLYCVSPAIPAVSRSDMGDGLAPAP